MTDLQDRFRGCLVGLAVGDALGAQVEFKERPIDPALFVEYQVRGPWKIPAGGWTDDTAQALCLAEGLLAGDTDTQLMDRFVRWLEEGYNTCNGKTVGIGGTVLGSLMTYRTTGQILPPTDEYSAGNGCIMRLAPVVLYYYNRRDKSDISKACSDSCKLTHGSETAINTTIQFGIFLEHALDGWTKKDILTAELLMHSKELFDRFWPSSAGLPYVNKTADGTIEHQFGNVYHSEAELKSTGYCVDTLECACWAFYHSTTFEDGMIKAIGLGGDTDTIGAVYGQLAGAYYGYSNIPQRWKDGLMWHEHIRDLADQLGTP